MNKVKDVTKGYKYRIYPNEEQKLLLAKTFGCNRFVWNQCLGRANKEFDAWKKTILFLNQE